MATILVCDDKDIVEAIQHYLETGRSPDSKGTMDNRHFCFTEK